ncbi:WG repeat-containing protein [Aeoliella sp. ICT_H6.2]|uniref:WG repeat-containing protein n=1 Tax=Aeoliella straminimaris TaxID=2954799 RepID=A0A9X2FDH8_9BACT|nr:WG repeat-containing protein [Aeoliella straminimaris]MCO6046599.1 WG repeat-containing protein [Aeoliella straminimaris]
MATGESALVDANGNVTSLADILTINDKSIFEESFIGFTDNNGSPMPHATVKTHAHQKIEWFVLGTDLRYRKLPDSVFANIDGVDLVGDWIIAKRTIGHLSHRCGIYSIREDKLLLDLDYNWIYPSPDGLYVINRDATNSDSASNSYYDIENECFVSDWYYSAIPHHCGYGAVQETANSDWYFVDSLIDKAFPLQFDGVERFSNDLAGVYLADKSGYLDTNGELVLELHYEQLGPFDHLGHAIVNRDELEWDLDVIDRGGAVLLEGASTLVFWDGDHPCYEVEMDGEQKLLDCRLIPVNPPSTSR